MIAKPRRTVLFMPATNARAIEKARGLPVDAIALDLEDSIAPAKKDEARAAAIETVKAGGFGRREVVMRLNGPDTPWFEADLAAAATASPNAILVPKLERPEQIERIAQRFRSLPPRAGLQLWIMIETPLGVLNAHALARMSETCPDARLSSFVLGTNDIQKETRALEHPDRMPLLLSLQMAVLAARAYKLSILDGVYNNFRDLEGFERECRQGRLLGMDGKTLIHPSQIDVANSVFGPSPAEVEWARRIISAFEEQENQGKGAISIDGQMVELLHLEIARRTVEMADALVAG